VKAADTSLVVAAFASWHEHHEAARRAFDGGVRLIEQCALETHSVLTRLPPPHRSPPALVRDFIRARFPQPYLRMSAAADRVFIAGLPEHDVYGGAAYDALVAANAVSCKAELVTCDRRAAALYESYGVRTAFIA
jgi:predicted nucleic acid-binding protein